MAQRIALHYVSGSSLLHRWDGRCKFLSLLVITISLFQANVLALGVDTGILVVGLFLSGLPLSRILRDLWLWAVFIFVIFIFQIFFTPGPKLVPSLPVPLSQDGLYLAATTCWRLALMLGFAILFMAVTRPRELQETVLWLLSPLPFLPGRRIGLMVSLTLRFFAFLLDQLDEVLLANKARLGERSRNPFRRAKFLSLPLLRRSFIHAEDVTLALFARGYREDVPCTLTRVPLPHWVPLLLLMGVFVWLWVWKTG